MSSIPIPQTSVLDAFQVELLSALQPYMEDIEFEDEQHLFDHDDRANSFFIVDDGIVRLEAPTREPDTDATLDHLGAGSFLGHEAMLGGSRHGVTAVADGPVKGRKVDSLGWRKMIDEDPAQGVMILRALARQTALNLQAARARVAEQIEIDEPDPDVEDTVARAVAAQAEFEHWDEERVDKLLEDIANSIAAAAPTLAQATVDETHLGNPDHKVMKIALASQGVYSQLAGVKAYGPIDTDEEKQVTEIAAPVGVIFGIVPVTNPVPTIVNKTLIALKSRNSLIYSVHRMAGGVGNSAGEIIQAALERHGAPRDLVQWVKGRTNRRKTQRFMSHKNVGLILATGGPSMVRAAYSSGTPAIGVGAGNAPCYVAADADPNLVAQAVIASKEFDNGLICGAEQHLVVDKSVAAELRERLREHGAIVLDKHQTKLFMAEVFEDDGDLKMWFVGQSADKLAAAGGVEAPGARLVVFEADASNPAGAQARERLAPVLSFFEVDGDDEAFDLCLALLEYEGTGHTANIHTNDADRQHRFAAAMPASRVLINTPSAHGCCGLTTGLPHTLTLGCGTWGGNSTTNNVTHRDLRNVKRMAMPLQPFGT
jgi:acyl-CoA reductase-like NAD-dependent aldehyde dehydrogenase